MDCLGQMIKNLAINALKVEIKEKFIDELAKK